MVKRHQMRTSHLKTNKYLNKRATNLLLMRRKYNNFHNKCQSIQGIPFFSSMTKAVRCKTLLKEIALHYSPWDLDFTINKMTKNKIKWKAKLKLN